MSKLFKLKTWLSVPDTARHLSIVFEEELTEADVFQLVLDGHLQLSVNFVNNAMGRPGTIVPISEAEYDEALSLCGTRTVRLYKGPKLYSNGEETSVFELEDRVVKLRGVFDLPMIGEEYLDVQREFHALRGGPDVTTMTMDGPVVEGSDGQLVQLLDDYDDNEYMAGSSAEKKKLTQNIADNKITDDNAKKLLSEHGKQRQKFLDERYSSPVLDRYYPASSLPQDSEFVVRTSRTSS